MIWNEAADRLLVELWNTGASLSLVADKLREAGYGEVTRSAIAGRKNCMPHELFRPHPPGRWSKRSEARMSIVDSVSEPTKPKIRKPKKPAPVGVEYFDNTDDGCRAILNQRGAWGLPKVCGELRANDHSGGRSSYCPDHLQQYTHSYPRR